MTPRAAINTANQSRNMPAPSAVARYLYPPPFPPPNKLPAAKVREIVKLTMESRRGSHWIAKRLGVSQTTILRVWERYKIDRRKLVERNALVEEHRDLARRIAQSVAGEVPPQMRSDLAGVAATALIEAAQTYDPGRGIAFGAYAQQRIRGACVDSIRRRHYRNASAVELPREESAERRDTGPSPEASAIVRQAQIQQRAKVVGAIERLSGRLAVILWLHYIEGQTLEAIARKLGVVSSRVSQLHREALEALKVRMGGNP
jgi:RNA polymerase sigma factor FliA